MLVADLQSAQSLRDQPRTILRC